MTRSYLHAIAVCLGLGVSWLPPAVASAQTFTNSTQITIPTIGLPAGISLPYPSNIVVSGLTGPIRRVSITLHGLSHQFAGDIDMLLVAPDGAKLLMLSDAGSNIPAFNYTITFDDYALYQPFANGGLLPVVYRPVNHFATSDSFLTPAPAFTAADSPAPVGTATFASQFNGHDGNGTWSLYVVDDSGGGTGKLAGGWSITFSSPPASPGDLLISEYRVRGPGAQNDEFIEIYNASGKSHTVAAVSGTGYGIAASDGVTRCTIPNGTVIPRGGHFLCVNAEGYSLGGIATGDATFTADIPDNRGIALFNNNTGGVDNPGSTDYSLASRLDAVGPDAEANTLYTEGGGFPSITPANIDYAIVRKTVGMCVDAACTGGSRTRPVSATALVDGNNNATDFYYADTAGTAAAFVQRLGAPGPENLSSPIKLDGGGSQLLYQKASGCSARDAAPNRVRDATPVAGGASGTLDLRTMWRNTTGANITRLRFRIIDLTTFPAPAGFADLRPRTSNAVTIVADTYPCGVGTASVTAQGTTLETPPQPHGGGFNASLSVGTITSGTPLANGASVTVRFLLAVQLTGAARFCLIPETLPAAVGDPFCYIGSTESTITTAPGDFDDDQKAEMPMYNPATGLWKILRSGSGYTAATTIFWGGPGYTAVPGDYDGDGKADVAVYRMSTGIWSILTSASNFTRAFNVALGGPGYFPQPGDYDGDGTTDVSAASAAASNWSFKPSSDDFSTTKSTPWASPGFTPVPGQDFDGDGKDDLVLYRENDASWRVLTSSSNFATSTVTFWGGPGYTLVPGDYNGDGQSDYGVHHRTTGIWSVLLSPTYSSTLGIGLGGPGFLPMPADYDGDRKIDIAYHRPSTGQWLALTSTTAYANAVFATYGGAGDIPLSTAVVPAGTREMHSGDFDGDHISDVTVYHTSTAAWSTLTSSSSFTAATNRSWGGSGYHPVPGDYDGDGKGDLAVYQIATGMWYVLRSSSNFTTSYAFQAGGGPEFFPVQGDYDGDGRTDMIVYNTETGLWYGRKSSSNFTTTLSLSWGGNGYTPAPGDYDGDGKADLMVYLAAPGRWMALKSSTNYTTSLVVEFGGPTYQVVPADYDADGITDICVYEASTGVWTMLKSSTENLGGFTIAYGGTGYTPVRGDFDGDGRADIAVYNELGGFFSILLSGGNYTTSLTRFWGGLGYWAIPPFL